MPISKEDLGKTPQKIIINSRRELQREWKNTMHAAPYATIGLQAALELGGKKHATYFFLEALSAALGPNTYGNAMKIDYLSEIAKVQLNFPEVFSADKVLYTFEHIIQLEEEGFDEESNRSGVLYNGMHKFAAALAKFSTTFVDQDVPLQQVDSFITRVEAITGCSGERKNDEYSPRASLGVLATNIFFSLCREEILHEPDGYFTSLLGEMISVDSPAVNILLLEGSPAFTNTYRLYHRLQSIEKEEM